jgi:hypothetical protein
MKTRVFLRWPEVPGFWPSIGWQEFVLGANVISPIARREG